MSEEKNAVLEEGTKPEATPADGKGNVLKRAGQPKVQDDAPNTEESAEATEAAASAEENAEEEVKPLRRVLDVSAPPVGEETQEAATEAAAPVASEDVAAPAEEKVEEEIDFSQALEESMSESPMGQANTLSEGDLTKGRVVFIGSENVFVNLSHKLEGFIARSEVIGEDGELSVEIGDEIEAYIVQMSASGIHLSKGLSGGSNTDLDAIENAHQSGVPVEGVVASKNKGGFDVTVFGQRAFCPMSQIDLDFTQDADAHVEKTYMFKVIKFNRQGAGANIVVSRAELLREERASQAKEIFGTLELGRVLVGKVRNIQKFGIFVDLGGLDGLVHVSELSWNRVDNPNDLYKAGEDVTVKIIALDNMEAGPSKARISLSIKQVSDSPWSSISERFQEGESYMGEVVRLESYGAFIQLAPGLDGLAHISEISLSRISHPRQALSIGQEVRVQIKEIDANRQRIALSVKALQDDPWSNIVERYAEGLEVSGTIENIKDFGVFVQLEEGVTALIPLSELNTEIGRTPSEDFQLGQEVTAHVLSVDPDQRRLTLSRRDPNAERPARSERSERSGNGAGGNRRRSNNRSNNGGGRSRSNDRRGPRPAANNTTGGLGTFADLFADKFGISKK